MSKFLILVMVILISYSSLHPAKVFAQENPKAATASSDIKQKLRDLQEKIASKANELKQQISQKLLNRAYTGYIKAKSDNSLTIATDLGTKIIATNQDTIYSSTLKEKTKFNQKGLAMEDYIVALGDIDENDVLTAKKIVKLPLPAEGLRQAVWGIVVSADAKTITIKTKDNQSYTLKTTKDTTFQSGQTKATLSMVKLNKPIIAVGTTLTDSMNVRSIFILKAF